MTYPLGLVMTTASDAEQALPIPAWGVGATVLIVLLGLVLVTASFSFIGGRRATEEEMEQWRRNLPGRQGAYKPIPRPHARP